MIGIQCDRCDSQEPIIHLVEREGAAGPVNYTKQRDFCASCALELGLTKPEQPSPTESESHGES